MMTLLDETARPTLRERIGRLLAECSSAEIAVGSIRLAMLDLTEQETRGVERCRILLGRLEARALSDPALSDGRIEDQLRALLAFLESGRVEIRSAGLGAWSPDFSIYRGRAATRDRAGDAGRAGADDGAGYRGRAAATGACLVGAHYFREPPSPNGPAFTALLTDAYSIATALARFEALWERSHDVLEPVASAVHRRQSFSAA